MTLPNGIRVEYSYDTASRLTGFTYKQGTTILGDLTYGGIGDVVEFVDFGSRTTAGRRK